MKQIYVNVRCVETKVGLETLAFHFKVGHANPSSSKRLPIVSVQGLAIKERTQIMV